MKYEDICLVEDRDLAVEEEREVLNPARTEVAESRRAQLGARFGAARIAQLDADCGSADNVRRIAMRGRSGV